MDKYIGTLLGGRYEILAVLGVGGMAMVYKARCRVLNRYVAIKILKDEYAKDEEFRRRFYNESQAVAKLSHNNIVAVYDVAHSDGTDYIVMELIDGISLKEYLQKKGHLSWQETVFFAQQIARALEHAHSRGIIHQDIKPHNIMLLRDGTAKVTDFGIARLESNQETRVMKEAIGSVHYISPEQAKGSPLDSRADLYSLGVVMYEMLTGKLPFEGDSAVAIVMQHINSVPLLPSELVPGIPTGMDDIVMHAMCPNVSKRYATAQQLYNDLERVKLNAGASFGYAQQDTRGNAPLLDETRTISYQRNAAEGQRPQRYEQTPSRREPADDDEAYAPRRTRKKSFGEKLSESPAALASIAVAVFAVFAVIVGALLLLSSGGERIDVPSFIGQDIDQVLALQGSEYKNFSLEVADERKYTPGFQEGEIIEQDPEAGKKVAKGTKIILTVCGAAEDGQSDTQGELYELPDFSNVRLSEVERLLKQNGLEDSYEIKTEPSDEIEKDYVIRTDPGKGVQVTADDIITVYVSTGKKEKTVGMPNVTGMTLEKARDMLSSFGLELGATKDEDSDFPVGEVCRQSVKEGTEVTAGTKVDLFISRGRKDDNQGGTDNSGTGGTQNSGDSTKMGSARIPVAMPDTDSAHVTIYLGDEKLFDKTFSPAGKTQSIDLTGPVGEHEVTVYVDGNKSYQVVSFN